MLSSEIRSLGLPVITDLTDLPNLPPVVQPAVVQPVGVTLFKAVLKHTHLADHIRLLI